MRKKGSETQRNSPAEIGQRKRETKSPSREEGEREQGTQGAPEGSGEGHPGHGRISSACAGR